MSSLHKHQPNESTRHDTAARLLRVVRVQQSGDLEELTDRDNKIEICSPTYEKLDYCWQTDLHECHFRIYYSRPDSDPFADPHIAAVRLDQFDYRLPSPSERIDWEDRFQQEMANEGLVWHEVLSFIYAK